VPVSVPVPAPPGEPLRVARALPCLPSFTWGHEPANPDCHRRPPALWTFTLTVSLPSPCHLPALHSSAPSAAAPSRRCRPLRSLQPPPLPFLRCTAPHRIALHSTGHASASTSAVQHCALRSPIDSEAPAAIRNTRTCAAVPVGTDTFGSRLPALFTAAPPPFDPALWSPPCPQS
jgi:hypothetical protein